MSTGRPPRRRAETRRRLLASALETFAERGFYGSTVEEICERAGFTRGAFYSNFASKEELFYELHSERTDRMLAAIEAVINTADVVVAVVEHERSGQGGPAAFAWAVERFLAAQREDRRWYLVNTEFTLHAVRHPEAGVVLAARQGEVRARIAELLARGLADLGRELTVDLDVFIRSVLALHQGSLAQSYLEPEVVPISQLERQLLPVLLAALSVRGPSPGPPGT